MFWLSRVNDDTDNLSIAHLLRTNDRKRDHNTYSQPHNQAQDERRGRTEANRLGIRITGLLGVLVEAKQR